MGSEVSAPEATLVEIGVAQWTLEDESGDAYAVEPFPGGVLVAVIDGIGHGPEAARAARIAVETLRAHAADDPARLATLCHEALAGTRGAVASLVSLRASGTLTWSGVGNVECGLFDSRSRRPAHMLAARGGVLGHKLPRLHSVDVPVAAGDTLALATDGVEPSSLALDARASPQANADRILATGRKGVDDALVLVGRCRGGAA
jgi:serine/threonine protein phosphatase PrpC